MTESAAVAGVGIDGALLQDLPREGLDWRLDPRVPADQQTGEAVYAGNDLDRGHLVRRADAVWGSTRAEAQQGNEDTFFLTNAAPQAAAFNQGEGLWLGLEDFLLGNAATTQRRLVVFTAPVLDPADPPYRGIRIPLRFAKVAAFLVGDQDRDQDRDQDGDQDGDPDGDPDGGGLTGLDLDQLAAVDRLSAVAGQPVGEPGVPPGWVRLRSTADVRW